MRSTDNNSNKRITNFLLDKKSCRNPIKLWAERQDSRIISFIKLTQFSFTEKKKKSHELRTIRECDDELCIHCSPLVKDKTVLVM